MSVRPERELERIGRLSIMNNQPLTKALKYVPLAVICVLLVVPIRLRAQADNSGPGSAGCSNRTLFGDYGALIEGTILGPNLPLRTVIMVHFDGNGNLTSVDHVVLNGMPPQAEWRPNSGTYTVNPDCTGTALFTAIPVHFVVVKEGKEFYGVVNGNAITIEAYRVK
jgi:hypothetical protein